MNENAETKIQNEIAREEKRLEKLENKIAEEERKIQQYKKRINQLEKRKQIELSREIKKDEKAKIRDQIFIGKTLLEKWEKEEITVDEMREIITILFKENGEKRKEFIAIINNFKSK